MIAPNQTTLSLVIDRGDLHWSLVRHSWLGKSHRAGEALRGLRSIPGPAQIAALQSLPSAGRIVLTLAPEMCLITPLDLPLAQWRQSRDSIAESIESLLPIRPDEAMLGLIERSKADASQPRSYLVAARCSDVEPWVSMIEGAFQRPIDMILAPQMALLGAGLADHDRADVIHRSDDGLCSLTSLERGALKEIVPGVDSRALESVDEVRYDLGEGELARREVAIDEPTLPPRINLAVSATSAPRAAPRHFAPLAGRVPRREPAWLAPAACLVLAMAFALLGGVLRDARYDRHLKALDERAVAMREHLASVQHDRSELGRMALMLSDRIEPRTSRWRSVLPELEALWDSLPEEAFVYRVRIDSSGLTLRGEATRASEVLERLERAPGFARVRSIDAPVLVQERGLEQFHVHAERHSLMTGGEE